MGSGEQGAENREREYIDGTARCPNGKKKREKRIGGRGQ
jgi:hypothetical protein